MTRRHNHHQSTNPKQPHKSSDDERFQQRLDELATTEWDDEQQRKAAHPDWLDLAIIDVATVNQILRQRDRNHFRHLYRQLCADGLCKLTMSEDEFVAWMDDRSDDDADDPDEQEYHDAECPVCGTRFDTTNTYPRCPHCGWQVDDSEAGECVPCP